MVRICMWFPDGQAAEAVRFYAGVLRDHTYDDLAQDSGSIVGFEAEGQKFLALEGAAPDTEPTMATSLMLFRDTQDEVDQLWDGLLANGGKPVMCGWLRDKYGFTWQVVPNPVMAILRGDDAEGRARAMTAMQQMVKLDIQQLQDAYDGKG